MHNGRAITRHAILALKQRALRKRVWTVALNGLEGGMLDVTIHSVDRVKSKRLAQVLTRILSKLIDVLDHRLLNALKRGRAMTRRASEIACGWGYLEAFKWRDDISFQVATGYSIVLGN